MAVGELMCVVVDVNDLDVAERFWSAVTGLPVTLSGWRREYSYVGDGDPGSLLLQRVPEQKSAKNRMHLDFRVPDVASAVEQVIGLGGSVVRPPEVTVTFPDEGDPADSPPQTLQWAVMADPFGNEFCLVGPDPARRTG